MKLFVSVACSRGHHGACTEDKCQCGCHQAEKSGVTPERWKAYTERLQKAEEEIWRDLLKGR